MVKFMAHSPAKVVITIPVGGPEAFAFAKELNAVLGDAGWGIQEGFGQAVWDPPFEMIVVNFHGEQASSSGMQVDMPMNSSPALLLRALQNIGINNLSAHRDPNIEEGEIRLNIGHKPQD